MNYTFADIAAVAELLKKRLQEGEDSATVLRSIELKALFEQIKTLPSEERGAFGKEVNQLKLELAELSEHAQETSEAKAPIDITAPFDVNTSNESRPHLFPASQGSVHPLMAELERITDIFYRMGFNIEDSREIDDDYHMFGSLNFPEGHPARDDWDTFMTDEGFVAPAHTSTMQNRSMLKYATNLEKGEPIAVLVPDRVFRNEDLDATHEHTFHQIEGIYVDKGAKVGHLIAILKAYMSEYFGQELNVKIQPFYFPFTEPSFEFAVERPVALRKDESIAEQWLEIGGCGMIHPNVMKMANIDPEVYSGFAWGFGVERMVMLRHNIEDIRHFESGKLDFLRQF